MNIIEMKNIEKIYNPGQPDEVKALKGMSLHVPRGDFVAIMENL